MYKMLFLVGVMLVVVGSSYPGTPTNNYFYYLEKFKKRQRRRDLPNVIIIESIHLLCVCVYVTTSLLVGNRALRGYYAGLTRCLSNHFLKEMQKTTRPMKTLLVVKTILNQKCSMPLKNQSIFKAGYPKRNLNPTCVKTSYQNDM